MTSGHARRTQERAEPAMRLTKWSLGVAVFLAAGARAAILRAQEPLDIPPVEPIPVPTPPSLVPAPPEPSPARAPPSAPAGDARLAIGYRQAIIAHHGFDTFAMDDRLSQLSVETSYAPFNGPAGAAAAGIAWDFGSRATTTGGLQAGIVVHRITVPLEGRLYLSSWAYGFGRVAPGVALYQGRLNAPATPLTGSSVVPAVDASAGVSFLLGPHGPQRGDAARVWLTPEIGYGWSQASAIGLTGERGPALLAPAPERLPEVAIRGPFFRAQIGFTL